MDNLLPRFAEFIAASSYAEIQSDPSLGGRLVLNRQDSFCVTYAPFDHVNRNARVVLVGITPGRSQAINALEATRRQLVAGGDIDAASKTAKETASFSGPMRPNLVNMLDHIGLHRWLGIRSSMDLFSVSTGLVHYTSALRYPVYNKGENYSGSARITAHPLLRRCVRDYLGSEADALPNAVWVPLGPWPAMALELLVREGRLDPAKVLDGLPHPSGANAERISYFLGRKPRDLLSNKTNPDQIDAARARLMGRMAGLAA